MMKNSLKLIMVVSILLTSLVAGDSFAANPYDWSVEGKRLNQAANEDDTVTYDASTDTLILNNYNGGAIGLGCYGSCYGGTSHTIELIGENYITTTENEDPIDVDNLFNVKFIGDGTLTIKHKIFLESWEGMLDAETEGEVVVEDSGEYSEFVIRAVDAKNKNDQQVDVNDNQKENIQNKCAESPINFIVIIILSSVLFVAVITIIALAIKNLKHKKMIEG